MHPDLRLLGPDDVPAWLGLLADAEAVDRTGEHTAEGELREEMTDPRLEVVGAYDGRGLVGYGRLLPLGESEGHFGVQLDGATHPAWRGGGLGVLLATWLTARARAVHAAGGPGLPGRASTTAPDGLPWQADVLSAVGMVPARRGLVMRRRLALPVAASPLPAGYRAAAYDDTMADALRRAHNEAFLGDHPGFTPWSEDVWAQWVIGSRAFRPALTRVVTPVGSDTIVAYVVTEETDGHRAATGRREAHVARVGTLGPHRGRGLASALLVACLHDYADAGFEDASLYVDADSPSGAGRVYARAGFEVASRWTTHVMTWPAVDVPPA
ncbi:MAG: GNAT family N-acetyltransferase [Nocardioidaceae bacterium]